MLDHEQASIIENYRPKLRNDTNKSSNKPNIRRHSSILVDSLKIRENIRRHSGSSLHQDNNKNITIANISVSQLNDAEKSGDKSGSMSCFFNEDISYIAAMENIHNRTLEGYFCWLQAHNRVRRGSLKVAWQ